MIGDEGGAYKALLANVSRSRQEIPSDRELRKLRTKARQAAISAGVSVLPKDEKDLPTVSAQLQSYKDQELSLRERGQ